MRFVLVLALALPAWGCASTPDADLDAGATDLDDGPLDRDVGPEDPDAGPDDVDDGPPVADAGPAEIETAPLSECVHGFGWADCGGDGPPRLGCGLSALWKCAWYVGGRVAEDATPSVCPATDICCDGDYGLGPDPIYNLPPAFVAADFLQVYGDAPWDAEREANVEVVVDPSVSEPAEPSLTCGGQPCLDPEITMWSSVRTSEDAGVSPFVQFRLSSGIETHDYTVELLDDGDGWTARVCQFVISDGVAVGCDYLPPRCAESGTLRLSAEPTATTMADLAGELTTTLDGIAIEARF